MSSVIQSTFAGGEFSPALQGRVDLAKYHTGLATCRNFIVQAYGGVTNRPGTIFCGEASNHDVKEFLLPFTWGDGQNYVLILGDRIMRVMQNGGFVTDDAGNPLTVQTPWSAADIFNLHYAQSADIVTVVHPKYKPQEIRRYAHNNWAIVDYVAINGPFEDVNTDSGRALYCSGGSGEITVTSNFDAFKSSDVGREIYFELQDYSNYKAWQSGSRCYLNDFVVSNSKIYKAVELSGGNDETRTGGTAPDHEEGSAWDGSGEITGEFKYGVKWQYICSSIGIAKIVKYNNSRSVVANVTKDIASLSLNASFDPMPVEACTNHYRGADVDYNGKRYNNYLRIKVTRHNLRTGTRVIVSGLTWDKAEYGSWQGEAVVVVIDENNFYLLDKYAYWSEYWVDDSGEGTQSGYRSVPSKWAGGGTISPVTTASGTTHTYKWALSAWCADNGYPSAVSHYQQRMIFAGSTAYPQHVWMTRVGSYRDFGVQLPSYDDDAITYQIASRQVNPIRHILSLRSLMLLTSSSEWSFTQTDAALTASTINVVPQSYRGSANLSPITVGNMALVVQSKGAVVRDLGYEWASDSFTGNDLCVFAEHLFAGHKLVDWDFAQSPYSVAWCVRDDGVLLGLTYMREQEVFAWHRHDTQGAFESVCCIEENNEDVVYVTVRRTINGVQKRYIERFAKRDFTDLMDSRFLDSSLEYDGRASDTAVTKLSGLEHLEGMTVGVFTDGSVHPDRVVQNGSITLQSPAKLVRVGLRYQSDLETLRIVGPDASVFGKKTVVRTVNVLCRDTRALFAGTDFDQLFEVKQRSNERYGDPTRVRNGWFELGVSSTWTRDGKVCIRQTDPLPITVLALSPDVQVGGA